MAKIRVRNFGPIKRGYTDKDGWIDIKKNLFFIGNQGSGKSTVAKLISTFTWLEKSLNRGDIEGISVNSFKGYLSFHKLKNYFTEKSYLEYIGKRYHFVINGNDKPVVKFVKDKRYSVPKIMYVPSERNFLSTIKDAFEVRGLPENLFAFAEEVKKAQTKFGGKKIKLELNGYHYEYNKHNEESFIHGDTYKINLLEASSGLQSYTPLYLVTKNLSSYITDDELILKRSLSVNQALRMDNEISEKYLMNEKSNIDLLQQLDEIKSKYFVKSFFNIVEEPEQNLFPASQWAMLKSLLRFNNENTSNKLLVTTHSPFVINYLTLAIKAFEILNKSENRIQNKLNEIVPLDSVVDPNELDIYEFNEKDGSISLLDNIEGLPSDNNYLNVGMGEINKLFSDLLELEDLCE